MASDLEICNAALMRLGSEPITSFSDSSKRAKLCLAHYDRIKKDLISDNPWNFSLKRVELLADKATFADTDVIVGADTITITAHGQSTGQRARLSSVNTVPTGLLEGTEYYIIKVDANTIKLATSYSNANAGTAIDITATTTGSFDLVYAALFDFKYRFTAPNDYLTISRVEPDYAEYQIEGDYIYSTDLTFRMIYQASAKEKNFSIYFNQALILKLAVEFSYSMIQSNELGLKLIEEADRALRQARLKDSQEGTPYPMTADQWRTSRL